MRVLFIGYGSIAQRHRRNLAAILAERGFTLQAFVLRERGGEPPEDICGVIRNFEEAADFAWDAVFITNPTVYHYQTLRDVIGLSDNFFLEKPCFEDPERDLSFLDGLKKTIYVACPLRYTAVIAWVRENVPPDSVLALRATSSSYLPAWRPGVDYRTTYSANSALGGGVSIDLIHEWDYVQYLFGYPQSLESFIRRVSSLELDSDDVAAYIADYGSMVAEVHLDYFGRATRRTLELETADDVLVCDLVESRISFLATQRELEFHESRDDYQRRELETFLRVIAGEVPNPNDLARAVRTLRLTKGEL